MSGGHATVHCNTGSSKLHVCVGGLHTKSPQSVAREAVHDSIYARIVS